MPKLSIDLTENDSFGICFADLPFSDERQRFLLLNVYRKQPGQIIGRDPQTGDTLTFDLDTDTSLPDGEWLICCTRQFGPGAAATFSSVMRDEAPE